MFYASKEVGYPIDTEPQRMTAIQILIARSRRFFVSDVIFGRVLANASWLLSANTITMALTFIQGIIVARMLGPEQYGILALITTYAATVYQFVDSRVWETAIKFVIQYKEEGDFQRATATVKLCYLVDAITGVLTFVIILLTAGLAAHLLVKDVSAAGLIRFYALSVLIGIPNGTSSALLRIGDRFDLLAYQSAGVAGLKLIGVLVVAMLGAGIKGLLSVYIVAAAAGILALVISSRRTSRQLNLTAWRNAPLRFLRGQYRRILSFTMYSNLGATSRLITSKADTLVLGWFATPSEVGLYRLARTLADPLATFFGPIYTAVYPEIARLVGRGDFRQIRSLQRKLSKTIAAIVFPACVLLTLGAAWIIPGVFGERFRGAILLTQIMVWQIVWTPLIWLPGWLLSTEHTRGLAGLNWLDALDYLILLLILVPWLGPLGGAVATLLRFILWTTMALFMVICVNRTMNHEGCRI